jgi:cell pole-organizing protein PopZ
MPEPPVRKAERDEPVPFAMRAARDVTTDRDEATSDDPPGIGIKFGALLNEADDDVSAPTPAMKVADDNPKADNGPASQPPAPESVIAVPAAAEEKEVKAPPPPEPVDLAAREPAIRRGVFGLPELADEEPAKDDASAPPPGEQAPKADGPPPFVGFDETFGARALEMLAEPPPTAEPPPVDEPEHAAKPTPAIGLPQQASPEPGQTPATETAAKSDLNVNPVDDAGPAIPLVAASAVADDVEAVQDTGPGAVEGSTPPPQADEGAASAAPETGQGPAGRSLEDTVSALLRPMLRDWLDTNMPGIVEKALKEELVPRDADPSQSDGPKDAKD